jgi:hypothetical protein
MWMEERIGKRVNVERTDEALGTGADLVTTSCPYCLIMLDDAVTAKKAEGAAQNVRVTDIAQILEDSIGLRRIPAAVGAPGEATTDSALERDRPGPPTVDPVTPSPVPDVGTHPTSDEVGPETTSPETTTGIQNDDQPPDSVP